MANTLDKSGKFIVIDGMDGSGKGTQIRLLQEKFQGRPVAFTREPGGTPRAEEIRTMILQQGGTVSNPVCDFFLFWSARGSHVEDFIIPTRKAGTHVICDRYDSSTFAFQIRGEETHVWLEPMFKTVRSGLPNEYLPDLYVVLDLPPEVAFERRSKDTTQEKSKFDIKPLQYHERVRAGFKEFATLGQKVEFVDANRTPEEMHADIFKLIEAEFSK